MVIAVLIPASDSKLGVRLNPASNFKCRREVRGNGGSQHIHTRHTHRNYIGKPWENYISKPNAESKT